MDARTTLNQLTNSNNGTGRLSAMIGAHSFVQDTENYNVMFAFKAKAANKANKCRITLNAMDTYDVEFFALRGVNCKVISKHEGIYNDMLKSLFEKETGLYLSL
jgi:hypothetical protein